MKKLFSILAITALVFAGTTSSKAANVQTMPINVQLLMATTTISLTQDDSVTETQEKGFHQELKERFVEGGPGFMGIVLLCLILGLAFAIERIIYLNLATTNTKKLADSVEEALKSCGIDSAKEVCRNTKGPVASIYYQGLDRADEGVDAA